MPISGLIITLGFQNADSVAAWDAAATIEAIREHNCIDASQPMQGSRLPIVVDTPDRQTDRDVWDWLHLLPGVRHIDVVFIHFDEHEPGSGQQVWRHRRNIHSLEIA